jgi:HlyD family secretion protein
MGKMLRGKISAAERGSLGTLLRGSRIQDPWRNCMNKRLLIALVIVGAVVTLLLVRRTANGPIGLKVSGTLEVTTIELAFKVEGRLHERLVDEGETVRNGQTVARLDSDELMQDRDARAADLRSAEAALADLQAGSRREEIARGEATLNRVKAEADRAAADYFRSEELLRREVISRMEYDAAKAAKDSSAAALREAEENLRLLKAGPRPDAVRQAKGRQDAAQAALALSATRLAQAVLASPANGIVLSKHAEPGEMLTPGSPVITIGKMDEVWLKAYIPETELGRVKVGQIARVTSDTWPDKVYEGKISFISPQAEFTPKNVQTEKERVKLVYRVKITLSNPNGELKPGMPADAVIETGVERK